MHDRNLSKPYIAFTRFYDGGRCWNFFMGAIELLEKAARFPCRRGIGLVPDVGGSDIPARAPGYFGEYLANLINERR